MTKKRECTMKEAIFQFIGESKANFKCLFEQIENLKKNDLAHLRGDISKLRLRIDYILLMIASTIIIGAIKSFWRW